MTGRGGDIIIVDDPLKPIDALSDSRRKMVNDWYFNTLLSRLDNKQTGAIVVVMQRLHMEDLTGTLLRSSDQWTVLSLAAIAEQDEYIQIGENVYRLRHVGDVLHPERDPKHALDELRSQVGSDTFAAQWQQTPVPPGGSMIQRSWVRRYDELPIPTSSFETFQSWDTASKDGGQNDYSVCTTWLLNEGKYYLKHVLRDRFDYPTLKARAIANAREYRTNRILIEDTGVGTALIPELLQAGFSAIAVKPQHDKKTRMAIQSAKFESGRVFFPRRASWLADLETELFSFPASRHDDQVDSISQALAHEISYGWNENNLRNLERFLAGLGGWRLR